MSTCFKQNCDHLQGQQFLSPLKQRILLTKTSLNNHKKLKTLNYLKMSVINHCLKLINHSIRMCRMRQFLAILRSFFHSSLLYTLSIHTFPPTSLPISLTSSCHLFHGLPLSLVVSKFYCLPFSVHAQTNVIYLTLLSVIMGF